MQWTKPEFQEITLNMEVTGYVNVDGEMAKPATASTPGEASPPVTTWSEKNVDLQGHV
jgi:coenzyme PQQ precursor peptide PqqA